MTGNSGANRVEQGYTVSYATVAAPTTFIDIATIADISDFAVTEAKWSITEDSTGILASNVATIRYVFPLQALSGVQYKEIDIIGIASIPEASPTETFTSWASEQGLDGTPGKESGFFDDPDGDGLSNGVEAWFGTDPTVPGTGLTELVTDGTTTTFQHPQNTSVISGVSIYYNWSLDLTEWYAGDGIGGPDGGPTVSISSSTEVDITTTTATANEPLSTLFLRAGVIQD
jgi:hypothetical protein